MKILKFRAFDGKSMRYDVTGFEHGKENEMSGVFLDGNYYEITETIDDENENFHPVAVVMQFTGLHDKNGKEIYEGDVVNYYRAIDGLLISRGKIMHSLDHSKALDINQDRNLSCDGDGEGFLSTYGLVCGRNYFMALCHYCRPYEYMEIIGNIHQNPELLES